MSDMVCPSCGDDTFEQTRTARIEFTMTYRHDQWIEQTEEVVDSGDRCDDPIVCANCGWEVEEDELLTPEQYEADTEDWREWVRS